ncbi:MAG: hypothetical protein ACSHX8_00040 [Opitutaceae bacterium]
MSYKVRISHINPDFSFDPLPESSWVDEIPNEEGLIFLLNRIAVAALKGSPDEYPEVEIICEGKRVNVTVLSDGQLLYNDKHSNNQQNLKVIAEDVIRLLENVPLVQIFLSRDVEDKSMPVQHGLNSIAGLKLHLRALLVMCVTLLICGSLIYKDLVNETAWIETPEFTVETSESAKELSAYHDELSAYHGVYVNAFCEGGLLFEIKRGGTCNFYEMWNLPNSSGYGLISLQSLPLAVGRSEGEIAFLAGELHMLRPLDHQTIQLHNLLYLRYDGPLKSVGELVAAERFKD